MPTAPARPCVVPQCAKVAHARGRCTTHATEADRSRGTAKERGYDYAWSQYSIQWRTRFPLCGMRGDDRLHPEHSQCVQQGRETPAQCVDHIVPMSKGGEKWNPTNHQSLCLACNSAKGNR
jgi:5-methylcytosine-specific restriction protein A